MKIISKLLICIFILSSCNRESNYTITNSLDMEINDKAVVLERSEVLKYINDTADVDRLFAKTGTGEWLPTQCDDLNGDGKWDELAFLCDLDAGETVKISFEKPDTFISFPQRTNVRFGRMVYPFEEVTDDLRMKTNDTKFTAPVYQMEGPAWENDVIAFRNYYDARNGIDIFGKTTSDMVLDSVGVNGRNYHELASWGMDILKVGNSLGAGAIAIGIGDSVYRVGPCEKGTWRMIAEGPVRAVLELEYNNVPAGDRTYNVKHEISIYAGDRFYKGKVWMSNLKGDEALVTGIVNLHDIPADSLSENGKKILFATGNQGFLNEVLGMGVIIPAEQLIKFGEAPATGSGIINTHLAWLKLNKDMPAEYRFIAVWENESPQIKDAGYFKNLLLETAYK